MTAGEALASAGLDAREARLLLAEVLRTSEASVLAFPEREVPEGDFWRLVERRRCGEPVAYILGRKEFYGLELEVGPDVLIPRPETELLVDLALEREPRSVIDLGTGSGAIALAIKRHLPGARVLAVDSSEAALAVAARNAARHGIDVELRLGDWLAGIHERFDLIVSNPPYVALGDPHLPSLRFEPSGALLAGPDGLDAIRRIVADAPRCLKGGWLLVEHGLRQDAAARALMTQFHDVRSWNDLSGIARASGGRREKHA